jgi:20S proteasome alpha/beta subunit
MIVVSTPFHQKGVSSRYAVVAFRCPTCIFELDPKDSLTLELVPSPFSQVEYAIEAIKLGSTAVGLQTNEGTVLAVEKRLTSPLLDPQSVEKIAEIDSHVGAAMSGLVADARTLVDHARVEAQNHRFTYDEPIGVEPLTQGMCCRRKPQTCSHGAD